MPFFEGPSFAGSACLETPIKKRALPLFYLRVGSLPLHLLPVAVFLSTDTGMMEFSWDMMDLGKIGILHTYTTTLRFENP